MFTLVAAPVTRPDPPHLSTRTAAPDPGGGGFASVGHGCATVTSFGRTLEHTWPTVGTRTILWLGRHTVHEVEHHLLDLARWRGTHGT